MEILILCGIYLVELVCYQLGLRILFEVRQKTKVWMIAGVLMPVVIGNLPIDASGKNVLVSLWVTTVTFLTSGGNIGEKGARLTLTFLLLMCTEEVFRYFCNEILVFKSAYIISLNYLEIKSCSAVSILIFNMIKNKIFKNRKTHIDSVIYLVLGVIGASMLLCLASLNYAKPFIENSGFKIFCSVLNLVIYIGIFLLIIFIVYIKNTHEHMEQLLKTEQLMKESQVNYYKQLLKKETDTRKYRHDMVNHLIYIQDILRKNKVNDAARYVDNILGGFKKIQNTYYVSGNEMVDTIMNYFFGMLPGSVEVDIRRKCPVEINAEETDICTIFSNIFQNAVEEIIEHNILDAKIIIEVKRGRHFVQYNVRNSLYDEIKENEIGKNGLPKSSKSDKRNHGIGMINTKNAVERSYGKFGWYQKDGYFCVNLILPVKY